MLSQTRLLQQSLLDLNTICPRCLSRLSKATTVVPRRRFTTSPLSREPISTTPRPIRRKLFRREYFSANGTAALPTSLLQHLSSAYQQSGDPAYLSENGPSPSPPPETLEVIPPTPSTIDVLPHRRRKRLKDTSTTEAPPLPPDASSLLSTLSATSPPRSLRRLLTTYLSLSKPRLTFLIVLTTASSYSLYPVPDLLTSTTTTSPSLSALTLLFLTTGTALCSASANTLNMYLEPASDALMSRTRNRPLVRGLISPRAALLFALATGLTGLTGLHFGANPTVSFLGALNIILYAGVYTPLKRISVLNTWVGALVGGIPPLMGWAAAAGHSATGTGAWHELLFSSSSAGGWLLAGLLFAWQFPHFNALSWTIRDEYRGAGYRMLAWVNPAMNARVALRYSLLFFPICAGLWGVGITDAGFLVTSSVVNAWVVREAWRFWRYEGGRGTARGLFWAGVWQLPVLMVLAMAHKRGLWAGFWGAGGEEAWEGEEVGEGSAVREGGMRKVVPVAEITD